MAEKPKYAKLIMVTADNNNKYYEMQENNGKIDITYGRVELTSTNPPSKPMSQWDKIFNSKVKKGYKDVTHLVNTEKNEDVDVPVPTKDTISSIQNKLVRKFMQIMNAYTNNLIKETYSVKADDVSQAQVDEAQGIITALLSMDPKKKRQFPKINAKLLELYTTIPRYMSNTRVMVMPHIDFEKTMIQEQDNLDAMASKVNVIAKEKSDREKLAKKTKKPTKKKVAKTILDELEITMVEGKDNSDISYLVKQVNKSGRKVAGILSVEKKAEDMIFDKWMKKQKDKSTRYLIHGTRCTSVIPIIEQGLKIRPSGNFQFSGKAYGNGNYFSEVVRKSLGYCGYDKDKVLLVYEVHTGNPFVYAGWYRGNNFTLSYKELHKRGYDSTHVNAGNGLLNSEIIAYKEEQCRLKHIIWLT